VAFDAAGTMYVSNWDGGSVTVYAAGWTGGDTAPTQILRGQKSRLYRPTGPAIDAAGNLYVGSGGHLVLMFGVNDQTIDFWPIADGRVGALRIAGAEASSGLPVTFTSLTTGVCTVRPDGWLTLVAEGTCVIAADQPGIPSDWNPAPQTRQAFSVNSHSPQHVSSQRPTRSLGLPAEVAASGWTRLVRLPVTTNAGQRASVRANCAPLRRSGVPAGDSRPDCRVVRSASAVRVWVSGQRAVLVQVRIHAPAVPGYSPYTRVRTYR
jgi:hypothetical protein